MAVLLKAHLALGGLVFFRSPDGIDPAAIGRLSVAKMKGGPVILCNIGKGFEPGKYELETRSGIISDAVLQAAAPMLWIRP